MLGQLLFESGGRITGQRVLSVEDGIPKFEISITRTGTFTGSLEVTETWTYWTIQRTDGTSYGEANGVIMAKDRNEMATATGRGEGRMMESGKMRYQVPDHDFLCDRYIKVNNFMNLYTSLSTMQVEYLYGIFHLISQRSFLK